ncbi:hypothetical protein KDA_19140 [Dictyobacter alpinus]|uniref:Photosynthesis system II assembly factor Ycf48/Hcf136-like domain-containing protein n=1 Tax=Dictyobacter alpinus TaxID=2014873 RepID=A0A402B504_9CHLR|nr:hypothetical protein [Dictyobacter alpinus]GCE26430.1 hypothetical protein KDA_19140 [Dictyobacter alpinus]
MFSPEDLIQDELEYPAQTQQLQQSYPRSQADQQSLLRIRTRLLEQRTKQITTAVYAEGTQEVLDEELERPPAGQFQQPPMAQPIRPRRKTAFMWYRVALVAVLCTAILGGLWYALKQFPSPTGQPIKPHATPTAVPQQPPQFDVIVEIKMTSAMAGWARVITNKQLSTVAHTTDGGKSWHTFDFHGQAAGLMGSFFLDDQSAWVILGAGMDPHTNVNAMRTTDGGQHWQPFQLPPSTVNITFLDRQHGWAWDLTPAPHIQGSRTLYRTVDGGVTWNSFSIMSTTRTIGDPTPGPLPLYDSLRLIFVTSHHGWAILSSVTGPTHTFLYQTQDGGTTWELQTLPQPASGPIPGIGQEEMLDGGFAIMSSPRFFAPQQGVLSITSQASTQSSRKIYLYTTSDGGQSWVQSGSNIEITSQAQSYPLIIDTTHLLLMDMKTKTITPYTLINNQWQQQHSSNIAGVEAFSAVNAQLVWIYARQPTGKQIISTLYTSSDAGKTWYQVMQNVTTPPVPIQGG